MKIDTIILSCLLSAHVSLAGNRVDEAGFHKIMTGSNEALVAFIEPSTAASQALEPEWALVAQSEKSVISVDCSKSAKLCRDYKVISYPALRHFDGHGNMTPYRGSRTASAIISFLRRASSPTITDLNKKKLTTFQLIDDVVIVAHLHPQDEHIETSFKKLASRYQDRLSFGSLRTTGASTIVCYNNRDDEQSALSELTVIGSLEKFIDDCMAPLIGEFTRRSEMRYLQSGKSLVYYFATDPKQRDAYLDVIRPLAKKYKEYLSFVTVDANEYSDMGLALGIPPNAFPAVAVQNPMYGQVFPLSSAIHITAENVEAFVLDIVSGKAVPWDATQAASDGESGHSRDEL